MESRSKIVYHEGGMKGLMPSYPVLPKVYVVPGRVMKVKVGQESIIALEANPTTGYIWEEEFDDWFYCAKHEGDCSTMSFAES